MSAIYTLLVTLKSMLTHLGQHHPVFTLDEKIYVPAKEIRANTFTVLLVTRMKESGLEDKWQESNFYREALTAKVMEGKHHYRVDMRHRITSEALQRLRFCKFLEWPKDNEHDHFSQLKEKMNNINQNIRSLFGKYPEGTAIADKFSELQEEMQSLTAPFEEFISLGISKTEVLEFWNEYVEIVNLLLKFIAAERNSNWQEHLSASTEMAPYDRAFDHPQYFRWRYT